MGRLLRHALVGFVAALTATVLIPLGATSANAASLWNCTFLGSESVCTRITSAPGGVWVLDRAANKGVKMANGTSVVLGFWWTDTSGLCGINGDSFVWQVVWYDGAGRQHYGVIGDYYLATGSYENWKNFSSAVGGRLGDRGHGPGRGPCTVFPNG